MLPSLRDRADWTKRNGAFTRLFSMSLASLGDALVKTAKSTQFSAVPQYAKSKGKFCFSYTSVTRGHIKNLPNTLNDAKSLRRRNVEASLRLLLLSPVDNCITQYQKNTNCLTAFKVYCHLCKAKQAYLMAWKLNASWSVVHSHNSFSRRMHTSAPSVSSHGYTKNKFIKQTKIVLHKKGVTIMNR